MTENLVSIIMPVYNAEIFLEKSVRSVMNQTYKNIEIILIDDGSKDSSAKICENLAIEDSRIRVVHQHNQGPAIARKNGYKVSKGEYITFVDNDDILMSNFIEILYRNACEYNCDISLTKSFPFLNEEEIVYDNKQGKNIEMSNYDLTLHLLNMDWYGIAITMTKLIRRDLMDKITFNENRIIGDDDSIIYQLYWLCNKAILYDKPLYCYRMHREGSITHSKYQLSWLTGVDAFYDRMMYYKENDQKILYAMAMRSYVRRISDNIKSIEEYYPSETKLLNSLYKQEKQYAIKMFFLPGNTIKQKISALFKAFVPKLWIKLEGRYGKSKD